MENRSKRRCILASILARNFFDFEPTSKKNPWKIDRKSDASSNQFLDGFSLNLSQNRRKIDGEIDRIPTPRDGEGPGLWRWSPPLRRASPLGSTTERPNPLKSSKVLQSPLKSSTVLSSPLKSSTSTLHVRCLKESPLKSSRVL